MARTRQSTIDRAESALRNATCTYAEFRALNPGKGKYDYATACANMLGITSRTVRNAMRDMVCNDASYD